MSDQVIMAAGCMLHLLPKLLDQFGAIDQTQIRMAFGPSGSLRKKIDDGENCSLFISAVSKHTNALLKTGKLYQSSVLGLNPTVLVCRSDLEISTETVFQFLTDPQWALGVSTTGLDPDADEVETLSKLSRTTDSNLERSIKRDGGCRRQSRSKIYPSTVIDPSSWSFWCWDLVRRELGNSETLSLDSQ